MSLQTEEKNKEFDAIWAKLGKTVAEVLTLKKIDRTTWSASFNYVYKLCSGTDDNVNKQLYRHTKKYLDEYVIKILQDIESSDEEFLVAYYKNWAHFSKGIESLNYLYYYFNKNIKFSARQNTWIKHGSSEDGMMEIGQLGLYVWKKNIILPLQEKLVYLIIDGIHLDRQGVSSNQSVFHGAILSIAQVGESKEQDSLKFYQDIFEIPFLEATSEYYQQEASRLIHENSCSQYMEKVLQILDEEDFRSRKYLHPSSYDEVRAECEQHLVKDKLDFFLSECKKMVDEENRKDLQNLYILLKPFKSASESLIQRMKEHIINNGFEAINANKGDNIAQAFIESIMAVHDKFRNFIETVFNGDHRFVQALDEACSTIVNHKENPKHMCRSPELLVRYCDSLLKKNVKACSENEVENKMNKAITIFNYLADKDVFQKFYSKMMARRIVYNQSMSMEAEEAMIEKLKQTCGYEFTSKFHRILTDVGVSSDLNSCFMENLRNNNIKLEVNFSILVFQFGGWPLGQTTISTFSIPQELEKSLQQFESFYSSKFSGRKLVWLHQFSEGELKLCYLKKSYFVRMSTYQMAILLLYQQADILSFEEILEMTKLNAEQLEKQIQGLLESKLLLATDSKKPIEAGSSFRLNTKYSNKRTKFRLSAVVQRDAVQQEVRKTHDSVDQDRKNLIQAAIVRIMKSRKVLKHNTLIEEVINQVKDCFKPSVIIIKKCIEILIEREYIERTAGSKDEYSYIA